jgi:peptidoglycan/xylan/chitin deacetylase (PgdA/CDA1 family)
MIKQIIKRSLDKIDDMTVAMDRHEATAGHLIGVLFHSLLKDSSEADHPDLAPGHDVTVTQFRAFVEEMLELGYTIVSPAQLDAGLSPGGKYLAITFDDGYYNNVLALDVLKEFCVPATFFISTENVEMNKGFWWDAYGRELARAGIVGNGALAALARPKAMPPAQVDAYLTRQYGAICFIPRSDLDRPFKPTELREFARNPWVYLGNHTCSHAILTNCDAKEVELQITGCQEALYRLVGLRPIVIAYPNGNYSAQVIALASASGLRLGFTVVPQRSALPLDLNGRMRIGRFPFDGHQDVRLQCRKFAARFVPSYSLRKLVQGQHAPTSPGSPWDQGLT